NDSKDHSTTVRVKNGNNPSQFTTDVHLSTGPTFNMERWATRLGGYWDAQKWFVGDFNGDGKTDFAKIWNDNNQFTTDVHLSTGTSFNMQSWATKLGGYWDEQKKFIHEFNGDSKTNLPNLWKDISRF